MPIYEYRCSECGHEFEKIQKISDRAVRTCPVCKGRVERLISVSSFTLKGGGWYAEGYTRSSAGKSGSSGDSSKSSSSGGKSD
ncbi:MAG: hypothetical protein Kow0062_22520 [Acidobacteriota bacterium]|nr:MAG: zinc ribbon domain-containing protein [Acidobacteriota bacterium]